MAKISFLEESISVASRMKAALSDVHDAYVTFPTLIQKEHLAMKKSDLAEVERITDEKIAIGQQVDKLFSELSVASERLAELHAEICQSNKKASRNVSECIDLFKEIREVFREKGFGAQVFDHVLNGFEQIFHKFLEVKGKTKPVIERNKYVLTKMITARQENYRFWQEVAAGALASYDVSGKKKSKKSSSVLSIKA